MTLTDFRKKDKIPFAKDQANANVSFLQHQKEKNFPKEIKVIASIH